MLNGLCRIVEFEGECQGVCLLPWLKVALDPVGNKKLVED